MLMPSSWLHSRAERFWKSQSTSPCLTCVPHPKPAAVRKRLTGSVESGCRPRRLSIQDTVRRTWVFLRANQNGLKATIGVA